ncbi:hypothetical protein HOG21_05820 [bacterium]|jgi:hypothetical protein|nr:hypothetical protein [bacterium]
MKQYIDNIENSLSKIKEINNYYITVNKSSISVYIDLLEKSYRKDNDLKNVYDIEEIVNNDLLYLISE